jgi:type IV pilus assembly protein PilQ
MNSEQPSQPDTKSPSPAADSVTVTPTIRPAAKNAPKPQPVQVQGISFKQTPALARQASFAHAQLVRSGLDDGSVRIAPVVYSPTVDSGMDLQISEPLQTAQAQTPALAKSDKSDSTPAPSATPTPSPAVQEPASTAHVGQISGRLEVGAPTKSIVADQPKAAPVIDTVTADAPSAATPPRSPLCNSVYRGENITITNESNRPLSLLSFINRLNEAYNANIVLDYDVQEIPVRLTINQAPWTSVLRTLLDLNDLDMVCLDGGLVQIAKRSKIAQMSDLRRKAAPIIREVFKLRYLQPTAGGRANLAGQTQPTNGATIQSLEDAIRDILKAGGDTRGEARRVPGRNELLVAATRDQMEEIQDLISRVDRPGYQVKISALVYTANENQLRDLGSQLSIVVGNANNTNLGGFSSLPNIQNNGSSSGSNGGNPGNNSGNNSGGSNGQGVAGRNPGGIPGLAAGMHQPTNGLGAGSPLATFGVTSVFGTAQFAYQLTLAQQRGVVNIQSRPFGIVSDGDTFDLVAGTQIPVVTTTIAGGTPFQSGQVQFIEASRIARITPQVAEDETGRPNFVTLNVQLENNSVDTSLGTFNGVPGVNRQSLQTVLRLHNGETVVIGGLAADQVANSMSKVPGLADIPGFGNLFKKKTKQENRDRLYFAITVEVIPQDATLPNFQAPADAMTTPPPPPSAQRPTPYRKSVH